MTDHVENVILAEANRLGIEPNADAMRQAAIDLAGAVMTEQGLISLPGRGSIAPRDYVRSLYSQTPESFGTLGDKPVVKSAGNLTESMRREVAAGRRTQSLPADFQSVRARYSDDSVTARMMDEIAANRRSK